MVRVMELRLPLSHSEEELQRAVLARLGIGAEQLVSYAVVRRGVDARKRGSISLVYSLDVATTDDAGLLIRFADDPMVTVSPDTRYVPVVRTHRDRGSRPLIVGTGPSGLFAGLVLAEMGFRPLLLERGRPVKERSRDTFGFWRGKGLDPDSNVQFGEGGAGTFSDGKLTTRIRDARHRDRKVLDELVAAGAPAEILYLSKPHIGTTNLVRVVHNLRQRIESLGGSFRFHSRVADLSLAAGRMRGVVLESGETVPAEQVVLAVGHSARDTFAMLHSRGVAMEAKPFSIGLRIEHPQQLIDTSLFGPWAGHPMLGPADYKLAHHCKNGRSVYSFCMCPGGQVVAATSEPGCVVTNGMSQYARSEPNANSAIVVGVSPRDYPDGPLAGIEFQRRWERQAFELGGGTYAAPVQLVGDFLAGRPSKRLGSVRPSYAPGVRLTDLSPCLPGYVLEAIREALPVFGRKIQGFDMADALLTGVETRTSSPLRILRGDDCQSISTPGLFPTGEGAGYAGGILSSAVDGIVVAEAVAGSMHPELQAGSP